MLPESLTDPRALAALGLVIAGLIQYQRTLSWSEYRTIHALKRGLLPLLDRYTTVFVVSRKGGRDDAEYVATVDRPLRETFGKLTNDGFSPHIINSIKQRPHPDGDGGQYSAAHFVKFHDDGYQSEVYLFDMGAETDVYAHVERSVSTPRAHLEQTDQQDGDVRNVLPKWVTDAR